VDEERSKKYYIYYTLFVLFRRKWLIFFTTFTFFALVFAYTFLTTPLWKGTAKVLVDYHPKQQLVIFPDTNAPTAIKPKANPINDLVSILTGQEAAREIVERFGRDEILRQRREDPETLPDKIKKSLRTLLIGTPKSILAGLGLIKIEPENYTYDATKEFTENLQDIAVEEDTNIIDVAVYGESPRMASDMANEMAAMLVEKIIMMNRDSVQQAHLFAKEQESLARRQLRAAETALAAFRKQHDLIDINQQIRINLDRRDELKTDYYRTVADHKAATVQLGELRSRIDEGYQNLLDSSSIIDNPSVVILRFELDKLQLELASMLTYKKEAHPDVIRLRAKIQKAEENLRAMTEFVVKSRSVPINEHFEEMLNQLVDIMLAKAEYAARLDISQMQMAEAKKESGRLLEKQTTEKSLADEVLTQKELYNSLRGKMLEFEALKNIPFGNFDLKIVDEAYVFDDQNPDSPMWILSLLIGITGGLFLGISLAFVAEFLTDGFRTVEEAETGTGMPVISVVKNFSGGKRIIGR
jgi:uncharacterized protein involved in exopolysaccharide biosynthesis